MNDVILAGEDFFQVIFILVVVFISIIISLIKKANEVAKRQKQHGAPTAQKTPWDEVKRFLQEAGIETQQRNRPTAQRVQRPQPTAHRTAPRAPVQRPVMQAPRPRVRQAPQRRTLVAPPPPPPPPPPPAPREEVRPEPRMQSTIAPVAPAPKVERKPVTVAVPSVLGLRKMSPAQLRSAIVLREVLGPSLAARGGGSPRGLLP